MRKKRKILNLLMVVAIVLIFGSGIMIVGSIKGWFGKNESYVSVMVEKKTGGANIERSGVAYALEEGADLRDGDVIQTLNGALVEISYGGNFISLSENTEVLVDISEDAEVSFEIKGGEVFAVADKTMKMHVGETEISTENAIFSVSAQYGSTNISAFGNELSIDGENITEGQMATMLSDGMHQEELLIQSLNEFHLERVRTTAERKDLCFTVDDIEVLEAERKKAAEEVLEAKLLEDKEIKEIEEQREKNKEANKEQAADTKSENTKSKSFGAGDEKGVCTITIRCDTILDNMDNLADGKNKYVPANGVILATSKITFNEGDTVFDVLKNACAIAGIQLEYAWTPMYNSYYIEGLNHLYEFDCGGQSGWMYKVNGWFPNYGCSSYTVEDGDAIVWCYTCKGLGKDVK